MSKSPADIFSIGAERANGSAVVIYRSFRYDPNNPLAISCTHVEPIANAAAGNPQTMVHLYGTNTGKYLGIHPVQESAADIRTLFRQANITPPTLLHPIGRAEAMLGTVVQRCGLVL